MSATGRCLCGAVTFVAEGASAHAHACHCTMCRRWSGGPALAIEVESVTFAGADKLTRYASSAWAERGFCSACGSNLFYRMTESDSYMMCQGAFDDQSAFTLHGEIFVDEKPPGYALAGDHSRMTGAEFIASLQSG